MPAETSGHAKEQNTTRIGESASHAKDNDPLFGRKRCFAHICAPSMGNPRNHADHWRRRCPFDVHVWVRHCVCESQHRENRFWLEKRFESESAVFAANSRLLETAKRRGRFVRERVDEYPPRLDPRGNLAGASGVR